MSNRRWLLMTVITVLAITALSAAAMATLDVYGVFRDPTGRQLPIYYADRNAKVLESARYVPANFNGLLIGPSSGVNWEPQLIAQGTGVRLYNESLEGGNASEEKLLVDEALKHGHFKLALVVLYPTMVNNHKYEDGIDKTRRTQALGSLNTYVQAALVVLKAHHIPFSHQNSDADGSHAMHNPAGIDLNVDIDYNIDPVGLHNLQAMVFALQAHGARIVYVIPPPYQPVLAAHADQFAQFNAAMQRELPPGAFIDLEAPEYIALRSDLANYIDDFHVTPRGAHQISAILNARLITVAPF